MKRTPVSSRLLTQAALVVGLAAPLVTPTTALAGMSCADIMQLVDYSVEVGVIVDAIEKSGSRFTQADLECVQERGAPPAVVAAVDKLVIEEAPPREAEAVDEPEEDPAEAARSRFSETQSLAEDISLDDDEGIGGSTAGAADLEQFIRDQKAKKNLTSSYGLFQLLETNAYPEKDSTIKYYLAKNFEDLEMYHAAQHYYMEVVRKGPSNPLFKHALPRLARIANLTGNDYEILRIVGKIAPDAYPRQARPYLHYLMGRKSYESAELSDASAHFEAVPLQHELYPRAQYFQGVINFERDKLKSAVKSFREVVKSEVPTDDPYLADELENLKDLSILNIGRIYFGLQRYEDADKYYSLVERDSAYWPAALFELGWSRFYQSDYNGALGYLLTVRSPYFDDNTFLPEVEYLRALVFFSYCDYDEVDRLLTLFEVEHKPIRDELKDFIDRYRGDNKRLADQAYDTYFGADAGGSDLPVALFHRLLRNRDFAALVRHMDMMDDELDAIDAQKAQWRESVGRHLASVIEADKQRYKVKAGLNMLQGMVEQYRVVSGLLQDAEVLRFEVADAQRSDYMFRMQNPDADALNEEPVDFATDPTNIYWPFNGEFWQDELAYYRYTEQGMCQ